MDNLESNVPIAPKQQGASKMIAILIVSAIVFGGLGYYVGAMYGASSDRIVTYATPSATTASPSPSIVTSPSPIDMTTWNTYTNKNFGFSMKYPEGWTYEDELPAKSGGTIDQTLRLDNTSGQNGGGQPSIEIWVGNKEHNIITAATSYTPLLKDGKLTLGERKSIKLAPTPSSAGKPVWCDNACPESGEYYVSFSTFKLGDNDVYMLARGVVPQQLEDVVVQVVKSFEATN